MMILMSLSTLKLILVSIFALSIFADARFAANTQTKSAHAKVEIISEQNYFEPGKSFTVALRFTLDEGWHIYWQNPGDSGEKPKIKLHLPIGAQASELIFPTPEKIAAGPFMAFGYKTEAMLLVDVNPGSFSNQTLVMKAELNWLECKEVCLPAKGTVELSLPKGPQEGDETILNQVHIKKFNHTRAQLPREANFSYTFERKDDKLILNLALPPGVVTKSRDLYFFSDTPGLLEHATEQQLVITGDSAELHMVTDGNANSIRLKTISGILSLKEKGRLLAAFKLTAEKLDFEQFLLYILFAFIGGLILNLMPCVLPVLSLKVMSLAQHRANSFFHGLVFSAGILVSFLLLAGVLLILRTVGYQFGWGFQMQSPWFVFSLSLVFLLLTLNLFGVFEIGLGLSSFGETNKQNPYAQSFFMGLLATVVATPCTAPFMGSALGFAVSQSSLVALTIFAALGVGMAFPYLLLSVRPMWLKFVPKPGPWMIKFKYLLAFLLLGTVAWLLFILAGQISRNHLLVAIAGLFVIAVVGYLIGYSQNSRWPSKAPALIVSLALVLSAFVLPSNQAKAKFDNSQWRDYNRPTILKMKESGQSYFIDFTADWCLSCKVNEAVSFDDEVYRLFKKQEVALFKADFTNFDPSISQALASYGRASVPLYVLFDGRKRRTSLLPEILTKATLINALGNLQQNNKDVQ